MDRTTFLAMAVALEETTFTDPTSQTTHHIRELTGKQRLDAIEAARGGDPEGPFDDALYRALVIQYGLLDGPGGKPLLTPADVGNLATNGREILRPLATAILDLSWATRGALKSGDPPPDAG